MKLLEHRFVEFIPEALEKNVLYISFTYGTVSHLCACGCGREVVTPLTPTAWKLTFDGETITLSPSIGNWNYPCRSHYWIRNNQIYWIEDSSEHSTKKTVARDRKKKSPHHTGPSRRAQSSIDNKIKSDGFWARLRQRWSR